MKEVKTTRDKNEGCKKEKRAREGVRLKFAWAWIAGTLLLCAGCNQSKESTPAANQSTQLAADGKQLGQAPHDLEKIPLVEAAAQKVKLGEMPDTMVILTVEEVPITIRDYRVELLRRNEQLRADMTADVRLLQSLIKDAKKNNIELTADERSKLLATAHKAETVAGDALRRELAASQMTPAQFDERVLLIGLATKVGNAHLQQDLLQELVDNEIICNAARHNGFASAAFNKYVGIKQSSDYAKILQQTKLKPDELKDKIVKADLVKLMLEKIVEESKITEADVQKYYNLHKDDFKEGESIRLSQIYLKAPIAGTTLYEFRKQLKQANPKWSEAQIDAAVKKERDKVAAKADGLLKRALAGDNFAELANQNSDDESCRRAKNGGDAGFQERRRLVPSFAEKVWGLKDGEVYSAVLTTPVGYHIVKVIGKKPERTLPFAEVKERLTEILSQASKADAINTWLASHRKTANISLSADFKPLVANPAPSKLLKAPD